MSPVPSCNQAFDYDRQGCWFLNKDHHETQLASMLFMLCYRQYTVFLQAAMLVQSRSFHVNKVPSHCLSVPMIPDALITSQQKVDPNSAVRN